MIKLTTENQAGGNRKMPSTKTKSSIYQRSALCRLFDKSRQPTSANDSAIRKSRQKRTVSDYQANRFISARNKRQ